ncbi:MAG: FAD-dependent oxidoreductase [Gammaproteobacteria bacterium]
MAVIARDPEGASRERYDLIIIGGGIHGAMLLLEAGRRGLRSLLVERGDFGGETSFQSLRIVHGGLRYLQALDLPRFFESVRERRWFLRTFPELVTPLPCLMPLYGDGLRRRGVLGAALFANDLLSLHRNHGVGLDRKVRRGRLISAAEVRSRFPDVDGSGLRGAALWYDARMPDSQRLLMETLRWACALGGRALNYVEAQGLCAADGAVSGISAIDTETGLDHRYHASVVVNATGPWSRGLAARFDRDAPELFRPSLAWNVWFARPAPSDCALALTARDKRGARTYFLHPWKGRLLAGTGHGPWRGDVEQPRPSEAELDEFLADLNTAVPGWSLRRAEVVRVFAGLLPARREGDATLAVRPVIRDHGMQGGPEGLFSVSGVKFTTSRLCAEKTLECIARRFPPKDREKLRPRSHARARPAPQEGWQLDAGELRAGPNAESDPGTHGGVPLRWRKALSRLIADESVQHLDDLVFRRTTLWEDPEGTASAAGELALLFGWGPSRAEEERSRLSLRLATTSTGAGAHIGRQPGFAEAADPAIVLEKKKA